MNIFLIILIALILILFLVLLCPVEVFIKKNQKEKLLITVSFPFFRFDLNKKASSKREKEEPIENKENEEEFSFLKKIKYYFGLISSVYQDIENLLSHIRIKNLYLKIICAEGDAALTAISYGAVCSVVYPLLGILESKTKADKGSFDLKIWCDYNNDKSEYAFNITLRSLLIFIIIAGIRVYFKIKKN